MDPTKKKRRSARSLNTQLAEAANDSVVNTRALARANVPRSAVERRASNGQLLRMHRGVYRSASATATRSVTAIAAIERARGSALCLWSANHWLGIEAAAPTRLHVMVGPNGSRQRLPDYLPHRLRPPLPDELVAVDGVPVTTAARTLRDFAAVLSPRSWQEPYVHRWVEEALIKGLMRIGDLHQQCERERAPHVRTRLCRLRDHHAGRGTEDLKSRGEVWLRDFLEELGAPAAQFNVRIPNTHHVADAFLSGLPLALEFDSYRYHWTRSKRARDARRQRRVQRNGVPIWPVTADDLHQPALRAELEADIVAEHARVGVPMTRSGIGGEQPGRRDTQD